MPVWTLLDLHGMDTTDPQAPKIVHGFMPKGAKGSRTEETWDVMGMRATRSDDTVLEKVFIPDKNIARVVPAGARGADMFVLGIFAWGLLGFAHVYYGLAERVKELIVTALKSKGSLGLTRSMAYHAETQHKMADLVLELDSIGPHIEKTARDWSNVVDYGAEWPARLVSAKYHAVESCWRIVDLAMDLSGGFGMFKKNELERLFRDARAGRFHPANSALTHEIVAKTAFGIDLDEQPRWG